MRCTASCERAWLSTPCHVTVCMECVLVVGQSAWNVCLTWGVGLGCRRLYDTVFAEVPRFNLLSLDMPDRFEAAIVDKVIKEQEKKTLEFVQVSSVTFEEINLEQANADVDIAILQANVRGLHPMHALLCV